MPCYHPLHAYKGKTEEKGKIKIAFKRTNSWRGQEIDLPCGQCIGCRLERARQWSVRCVHEASLYEKNCFITLTYDNQNIPPNGSLQVGHFQKFIKSLRKKSKEKIRYFHCGEYGERLGRPHYHAIIFNYDFEDKKPWSYNADTKSQLYTSELLQKLWNKGHSSVGTVTRESAGYVARYQLKKVNGKNWKEHYGNKRPEYCTMSRRPGIGKEWLNRFEGDVYPNDRVWLDGSISKPPRFYDEQLKKVNPELLERLKKERQENKKFCIDYDSRGKKIVELDSCDRRLMEKEKTKVSQISTFCKRKLDAVGIS